MGTLVFIYPATGLEVATGIEMDRTTLLICEANGYAVLTAPNLTRFQVSKFG